MIEINVKNIGPVEEFRFDLGDPGLYELHGRQGAGKTTCLRMIELTTNGRTDVRPSKRDGSPRGESEIAGKTIRIMKQVREEGELTVDGLGDLSIADLHSPGFKNAVTRDQYRIKTLVRLSGVEADATRFHRLLGGQAQFEEIVQHDSLTTDDMLEMSARVKRAIERRAQEIEEQMRTALANARAQQALYEAADTNAPSDEAKLQTGLETAISQLQDIRTRRDAAAKQNAAADTARETLTGLGEGLTVAEAEAAVDLARQGLDEKSRVSMELTKALAQADADARLSAAAESDARKKDAEATSSAEQAETSRAHNAVCISDLSRQIAELQAALATAQAEHERLASAEDLAQERSTLAARDLKEKAQAARECASRCAEVQASARLAQSEQDGATQQLKAAQAAVEQAKREGSLRSELQASIAAGGAEGPSDVDLQVAEAIVANAKGSITRGIKARDGLAAKAKAEQLSDSAKRLEEQARRLRDAATDTATVLTEAIGGISGCPLRIKMSEEGDPRLVIATDRSDTEPLDELSDGERWSVVMQIAAARNRLVVLPQHAYGELAPSTRQLLHELAVKQGCWIVTAVADDSPLHGVAFGNGKVAAE